MPHGAEAFRLFADEPQAHIRRCAHAGCHEAGEYRAPKSTRNLSEYHWFCLAHVREYNARWDYCRGLSPQQIEEVIRFDTIWNRETRPLGGWRLYEERLRRAAADFKEGEAAAAKESPRPAGVSPEVAAALALFNLTLPLAPELLRKRYRQLVKSHHPDRHGGSKEAEEKMKEITAAYALLKLQ